MQRIALLAGAAVLVVGLAACAGRANEAASADRQVDDGWHLEGRVLSIEPGPTATRVLVEVVEPPPGGMQSSPVVLLVSPETELTVRRRDGSVVPAAGGDLAVGARVRAEHTGEEMRSLAPQYRATRIRILEGH
jgi:hypothetical protein